jgi:hypothetical protein
MLPYADVAQAARATSTWILECPDIEFPAGAQFTCFTGWYKSTNTDAARPLFTEPDVFLPESEAVGNTATKRPETASLRNWQIIDTEITFPRNGIIVQWQVWVNEAGTVRLQVLKRNLQSRYISPYPYIF